MKETSQRLAAGARLPEHAAALGLRLLADDDAGLRAADEAGVVRVRVVSWLCIDVDEAHATRLLRGALTAMAWRQSSSRGLARPSPLAPSQHGVSELA